MKISLNNMLKNWKLLLILIVIFQTISSIIFYVFGIADIPITEKFILRSGSLSMGIGGGVAGIIFFIILHRKK